MYTYSATIDRWIDGDTVDMIVDLGFRMTTHQRFRLLGVDTPERGQVGYRQAREFCEARHPVGSTCEITTHKSDSFGRWLVEIPDLAEALLAEGLAVPYGQAG